LEVENYYFVMVEVRNFELLIKNKGFDPIGEN
jgi:hypothetical protein